MENKTLTPQEALRALPDWLEKEKHNFTINLEDRYPVGSHDLVDDCFQRCFELTSEQQKPRPIDENTPKDTPILGIFENGYIAQVEWTSWNHFELEFEICDYGEPNHWLPLPETQGVEG